MICMARTFGAPDTVPAGKHETSASRRSRSSASFPSTIDVTSGDVLLRGAHLFFESLPRVIRSKLERLRRSRASVRQAPLELALEEPNLRARELVQRLEVVVCGDTRVGDDQNAVLHVIE